jgi:hypothetical protein
MSARLRATTRAVRRVQHTLSPVSGFVQPMRQVVLIFTRQSPFVVVATTRVYVRDVRIVACLPSKNARSGWATLRDSAVMIRGLQTLRYNVTMKSRLVVCGA